LRRSEIDVAAARHVRQSQEDQTPHARARSAAENPPTHVATTDSDHDQPIFPNRTKDVIVDRPDRLWVADITYVAVLAPNVAGIDVNKLHFLYSEAGAGDDVGRDGEIVQMFGFDPGA
jgi:hypothetical protein